MQLENPSPAATAVFLLAENRLLRDALVRVLTKKSTVAVVGATAFSPSILSELEAARPNVVLLDSESLVFEAPKIVERFHQILPDGKAILIGMERDETTFFRALREGIVAYVLKDASAMEIVSAIRAVAAGEAVFPPCFSSALLRCATEQLKSSPIAIARSPHGLSRREQQLVELVRVGLTNKEIASRLNLAEQTIKNHVHRILRKVGASDRIAMIERCQPSTDRAGQIV